MNHVKAFLFLLFGTPIAVAMVWSLISEVTGLDLPTSVKTIASVGYLISLFIFARYAIEEIWR